MLKKKVVNLNSLKARLKQDKEFSIIRKNTFIYDDELNVEDKYLFYIVDKDLGGACRLDDMDIVRIYENLWTTVTIVDCLNNQLLEMYSSNVNFEDKDVIRIRTNDVCSPSFEIVGNNVILNNCLKDWLEYNNIEYKDIMTESEIYEKYEIDMFKPLLDEENNVIGYTSAEPFIIGEAELEKSLSEISDKKLAAYIRYIIKGRVKNGV